MYVHTHTKPLYMNAYSGFTHNHQNWKKCNCPLTGEWINNTVHPFNEALLSNKKRNNACNSTVECQTDDAKCKKPKAQGYILDGSVYTIFL